MTLDVATRRNLELTETIRERGEKGSLWGVLKATETAMGARTLLSRIKQPLLDIDRLNRRLDAVEALTLRDAKRESLRENLKAIVGSGAPLATHPAPARQPKRIAEPEA